ncbi:hypothetical protein TgHK011_001909 [Trichoderma gracile]|nr:hypothetical protein TgHK011_001909 [Trichoderma gracile]
MSVSIGRHGAAGGVRASATTDDDQQEQIPTDAAEANRNQSAVELLLPPELGLISEGQQKSAPGSFWACQSRRTAGLQEEARRPALGWKWEMQSERVFEKRKSKERRPRKTGKGSGGRDRSRRRLSDRSYDIARLLRVRRIRIPSRADVFPSKKKKSV